MRPALAPALAFAAAALACLAGGLVLPRGRRRRGPRRGRAASVLSALARLGGAVRAARAARPPGDLDARIAAAGRPAALTARDAMAAKLGGAVAGAALGVLLAGAAPGRLGLVLVAVAPAAGFLAPDAWLARRAAERARRARRELPALLDLLGVCVEAGLAPADALGAVAARADGPLASEWAAVARQRELGVPLEEALATMAARLPLPEVRSLVAALVRSARHGAPLAELLAGQAREVRLAQRRRVAEEAARAGPKIQLVVALLLVPSVLLVVAAALAAALLDGGAIRLS